MLAIAEDNSMYTYYSLNVIVTISRHEAGVKGYDDLAIVQNGCCREYLHFMSSLVYFAIQDQFPIAT